MLGRALVPPDAPALPLGHWLPYCFREGLEDEEAGSWGELVWVPAPWARALPPPSLLPLLALGLGILGASPIAPNIPGVVPCISFPTPTIPAFSTKATLPLPLGRSCTFGVPMVRELRGMGVGLRRWRREWGRPAGNGPPGGGGVGEVERLRVDVGVGGVEGGVGMR